MKSVLSISLASLILLQSFSKVWIVVGFKVNQRYIARVLCINRDKPERRCNGKCVLMQRIKAEEEQERKQLPQKLEAQKEIVYCLDVAKNWFTKIYAFYTPQKRPVYNQSLHFPPFVRRIFHPPDLATA